MPRKQPLYPHVPGGNKTQASSPMDLLKQWHQIIGEMLIDNDIDLEKYPDVKKLHAKTFRAIQG